MMLSRSLDVMLLQTAQCKHVIFIFSIHYGCLIISPPITPCVYRQDHRITKSVSLFATLQLTQDLRPCVPADSTIANTLSSPCNLIWFLYNKTCISSGKLSGEKTFANWWKIRFSRRKLSRIARFCCAKGRHAPKFSQRILNVNIEPQSYCGCNQLRLWVDVPRPSSTLICYKSY